MKKSLKSKVLILLLILVGAPYILLAQQGVKRFTVHGYVTDGQSGETMIYAGVACGREGTVTNEFGFYSITLPEGENEIVFSYLGYETVRKTILLSGNVALNVRMNPGVQLEASMVTGRSGTGIHATRAGSVELPKDLIKITPVLLGEPDVLKTIQLLPGVQSGADGFAGVFVRGGGDDENLFLLDGVPLYNPSHAFGLFSVFTPEAVKKVTFYKSDFPARFAGRTSSVVDVRTVDGDMNTLHGSVSAGLISDKFHLDGPIRKGRTSFSITGRAVHTLFLAPILKTKESENNYYFFDFNGKLSHKFSDKDRIYLGVYTGQDHLKQHSYSSWTEDDYNYQQINVNSADEMDMDWGNTSASFRWNHIFGPRLFSNTTVFANRYSGNTASVERTEEIYENGGVKVSGNSYSYISGVLDYGLKADFEWNPLPGHSVRFGVQGIRHLFRPESILTTVETKDPASPAIDTTKTENIHSDFVGGEAGLYAEDDFVIGSRLRMNLGVNLALFTTQGRFYFRPQPRVSLRYDFENGYAVKAGYSRMSQYIHRLSTTALTMPSDNWVPITRNVPPLTSDQFNVEVLWTGLPAWEFSMGGFYKATDAVIEARDATAAQTGASDWDRNVAVGTGLSYGAEAFVRKTEGRTTGWLAYTLSKTTHVFPDGSINEGRPFPFRYDRRHVLAICVNSRISGNISLSAVWNFASGQVVTMPTRVLAYYDVNGAAHTGFYIPSRGNYRLPPDHRLDISAIFTRHTKKGTSVWNVGVYNVYAHKNTLSLDYDLKGDLYGVYVGSEPRGYYAKLQVKKLSALMLIPSFSYTYSF